MNSKELRIGNFVHHKAEDLEERWTVVDFALFLKDMEYIKNVKPIKITEEWLEIFGFETTGYEGLFWVKGGLMFTGINYTDQGEEDRCLGYGHNFNMSSTVRINYVHELQNLYFSLTGQELL